jgi:hypothetical protein
MSSRGWKRTYEQLPGEVMTRLEEGARRSFVLSAAKKRVSGNGGKDGKGKTGRTGTTEKIYSSVIGRSRIDSSLRSE